MIQSRQPMLSNELVEIEPNGQNLVSKRLVDTMGSGSHCVDVTVDISDVGSPFERATSMLDCSDEEFVRTSQSLAQALSQAQTSGSIKAGSALFVQGTCVVDGDPARFIAIIKADPGEGLFLRQIKGKMTLTHVNNMLLGESQRMLKVALFMEDSSPEEPDGARTPDEFSIKVFDHLLQNSGERSAATYFYGTFLKCCLAANAPQQTKKFYETAKKFIAESQLPQGEKVELEGDLIAYLRSNDTQIIEVQTFARNVLPEQMQDTFINRCVDSGITEAISKDNSLLKGKLRRRSLKYDSNVTLYAPPDVFSEAVRIEKSDEEGWTRLKIRGSITT